MLSHAKTIAYLIFAGALSAFFLITPRVYAEQYGPYGIAQWPAKELGNHRAVIKVTSPGDAVRIHIPWRRSDESPHKKRIIIHTSDGKKIQNVVRCEINREFGDLVFQPLPDSDTYYIYYLPYIQEGWKHLPKTRYLPPEDTADSKWLADNALTPDKLKSDSYRSLPSAELVEIQAKSDFDRMDPMEVIATNAEVSQLVNQFPQHNYLIFPEDRRHPIRMLNDLPYRWTKAGPSATFSGQACRNEYYVFQLGVYACRTDIEDVQIKFGGISDSRGNQISPSAFTCFNDNGTDWLGRPFDKVITVSQGRIQPLWFGFSVPEEAVPGVYKGQVVLLPKNDKPTVIHLQIEVTKQVLTNHGDGDLWRLSRLRWLNSTIGIDDEVAPGYMPVELDGRTIRITGRSATIDKTGLVERMTTCFTESVQSADGPERKILASPMRFILQNSQGNIDWIPDRFNITRRGGGAVQWQASSTSQDAQAILHCNGLMECDGYLTYELTVEALTDLTVDDIRLEIPFRREFSRYMMGMGRQGGIRKGNWRWKWSRDFANHMIWVGNVYGGLQCKLMFDDDIWELGNFRATGLPPSWDNNGLGGCDLSENNSGDVDLIAYSGSRSLKKGQSLRFRFGLLMTPFHTLSKSHWHWRYFTENYGKYKIGDIRETLNSPGKIFHLHHGGELNKYINYPFITTEPLKAFVSALHQADKRLIIYYTLRELSNYVPELWAFRSLGDEIYRRDDGFVLADQFDSDSKQNPGLKGKGASWLWEHLRENFSPAWHHPYKDGSIDAAIATSGLSRLHNYYLEGCRWLLGQMDVDGLYLDGIGYDRQVMKRMYKVFKRTKPNSLISFHSGNNFDIRYGLNSPAVQYLEHLPYVDSLWFGEGYQSGYNKGPADYMLVEISGIPFGLPSEMLEGGGNLWRGMLYYGMASRLGWNKHSHPQGLWRFWDTYGIADTWMYGYWDSRCPVRIGHKDVLATAYVKADQTIIAIANWTDADTRCFVYIDWKKIGLSPQAITCYAPAIEHFQPEKQFDLTKRIPVPAGKGWLLVIKPVDP